MIKLPTLTRREALALGLCTFAGASVLPSLLKRLDLNQQVEAIETGEPDFIVSGNATLQQRAAAKKIVYGAATSRAILDSDSDFTAKFQQECALLIAGEDLLWGRVHPSLENYSFTHSDWLANFTRTNKMLFAGTHLVWHQYMPQWFYSQVNEQNAKKVLVDHINTVVKRYAGKIHFWTVVNEAVEPKDGRADGLRKTRWLELLGTDYIEMAFRAAAKADPKALLLYNDYWLEYDIAEHEARRTAVLKLLENLKSKGTPIHALGLQSHIWDLQYNFNPKQYRAFLRNVADLGLKIVVSEMDVADANLPIDITKRDRMVAEVYEKFLSVVLEEPAVVVAITWGLTDKYTWLSDVVPRRDGAAVRPLPYDANMSRKLAWNSIARAFDAAKMRKGNPRLWQAWQKLQVQA